ncbi:MAG: HepT-like ribonuclease domain-containing protein [Thermotogota bacterium]
MRPNRDRLTDILEAIESIRQRLPATIEELTDSELLQVWVVYHLQVIGEAANNLSPALVAAHPEVPWQDVIALRHVLVHRYFGVDLAIIWRLVADELPALEASVRAILEEPA